VDGVDGVDGHCRECLCLLPLVYGRGTVTRTDFHTSTIIPHSESKSKPIPREGRDQIAKINTTVSVDLTTDEKFH